MFQRSLKIFNCPHIEINIFRVYPYLAAKKLNIFMKKQLKLMENLSEIETKNNLKMKNEYDEKNFK